MAVISLPTSGWEWYEGGKSGASKIVGNDWDPASSSVLRRVARFKFVSPDVGASGVSFVFYTWKVENSGSRTPLNFYIGTDPDSHTNAGPDYESTGNLTLGSDYVTHTGMADIVLMPNTTYYIWVFPGGNNFGWCYGTTQNYTPTLTTIGIAHTLPVVRITDAYRCDADGNEDKQGAYALVVFDATVDNEDGDNTAEYILLYRIRGSDTWEEMPLEALNGNFVVTGSTHIFPVALDQAYEVAVAAVDSVLRVESLYRIIPKAFFFLYGDWDLQALGFGCASTLASSITMGMKMLLNKGIKLTVVKVESFNEINGVLDGALDNLEDYTIDFKLYQVGGTYWHCVLCKTNSQYATAELYSHTGYCRKVLSNGTWSEPETIR